MNVRKKFAVLALAAGAVGLMMVPAAAFGHAHPLGGTPFRVPMVIAFTPTTSSNPAGESHAGPLSGVSATDQPGSGGTGCGTQGGQASCALTMETPDNFPNATFAANGPTKGLAAVRIDVCPTAATAASASLPALAACTAPDVRIGAFSKDVRCGPTGTPCDTTNPNTNNNANDYTGTLLGRATIRITDHDNSPVASAVVIDLPFSSPQFQGGQTGTPTALPCQATADQTLGSTCTTQTTVNTFTSILLGAPAVKAAKLGNVETQTVSILDSNGAPFLTQGIFIP